MVGAADLSRIKKEYDLYREYYFGNSVKIFEKLAKLAGKYIKIKVDPKKKKEYEKINSEVHLKVTIEDIYALASLSLVISVIIGLLLLIFLKNLLIVVFFAIIGFLLYNLIIYYPSLLYQILEKKKEGQLVLAVMFLAMKLLENPNLEVAFEHTAKHLSPPLNLDFLRLLWDTYNKKYASLYEAIDIYLKRWEDKAYHFVIGMQLLISSLYEVEQVRREMLIDKAVEEMLNHLYERMSFYVRELQSPINLIYMLGIVLPTLLLTLFPLISVLMADIFSPGFLLFIFDVAIPFIVFILIKQYIEAKRIEAVSKEDLYFYLYLKKNDIKFKIISIMAGIFITILIFFGAIFFLKNLIFEYSIIAILVSGIFILSLGLGISFGSFLYYNFYRSFDKRLDIIEKELSSFLFSLGNALNKNIPLESAIISIYPRFKKKEIGKFIATIYRNIRIFNMSIYDAIFDKERGALIKFPSSYLEAAMEVIIESSKVSPKSAAKAAIAISRYFLYLERVKLRLLDLTAEVTSQMKSLAKILAPTILAIIVAVAIMSLVILYKLGIAIENIRDVYSIGGEYDYYSFVSLEILDLLTFKGTVSPATIYIVVGIFNIVSTILIAYMLNIIENGKNTIKEKKYIYEYLLVSSILFFIVATFGSIALWMFAETMMSAIIS